MAFPNCIGNKRWWTRERVLDGLKRAAAAIDGPLPCNDAEYAAIKKGHLDWPVATRVLQFFGGMARGWAAAGAPMSRLDFNNLSWIAEEDLYCLERAGIDTLPQIAAHLGRSRDAVHRHLLNLHITARGNQGFFSAAEFCQEFDVGYDRVCRFLKAATLPGSYDAIRNRWEIDSSLVTKAQWKALRAPRGTHKSGPVDHGDWAKRHHIRRIKGKRVVTYPVTVTHCVTPSRELVTLSVT